jgi:hypothetical protein
VLTDVRRFTRLGTWFLLILALLIGSLAGSGVVLSRTAAAVTVVTAPLAVIGVFLAAWQLGRTTNAAQAATEAAQKAAQDFGTYRILLVISDAHRIAAALDRATEGQTIASELVNWNRVGGELHGLLGRRQEADVGTLLAGLSGSFALATVAKENLLMGEADPTESVKEARKAISDLTAPLGVLSGRLEMAIGSAKGNP